jgi:hypothetical protein
LYPLQWTTYGQAPVKTDAFNNALKDIKEILRHINSYLADGGKTHFVGNRLTVADNYLFSVWLVHYEKYDGEGVLLYQTSKLMNGFLQRMDDKFPNYSFTLLAILDEEPCLEIQGVWLFRGKTIPQETLDDPQLEYYAKRELDVKKEEDRKLISDFRCAKAEVSTVNGLKVQDCKMFKRLTLLIEFYSHFIFFF